MTKRRIVRSAVSVFLSFALVLSGIMPGTPLVKTVQATEEETTKNITPAKTADEDASREGKGTMSISLKIKKTPAASDFTFTVPTNLMYDGTAKEVAVAAKDSTDGMGAVTVEYYSGDTKLDAAPTAEGTYTVKVKVAEGTEYKSATDITDESWKFTITPQKKTMTITLSIHGHEFAYSNDGETITATCNGEIGTCDIDGKAVSLKLTAPAKKVDTDSLSAEATIEGLAAFNEATKLSVSESKIEYYEGTTKLAAAPTTEGNYTAKLTVGTGDNKATAEVDYSIGTTTQTHSMTITLVIKEKAKITTAPKANELTYTGKAQELVTAGVAQNGTMQYKLGETGTYSDKIPTATDTGKYKVYYKAVKASEDYLDSDENSVEVSIEKAANTVSVSIDDWTYGGTASVPTATADFGADTATFTYSAAEDGTYTSTVPTKVGTYYVKAAVAGTDNYEAGESDPKAFAIKKAALTVTAEAKNITYGDEDVPLTYKVSGLAEGDTADKVLTGALAREMGTDAGTYKIEQGSLTSADYGITFVGADYVIAKAAQAAPAESFTTSKATGSDTSDGKISGFADAKAYQISSDNGATWTDVEASSTSLDVKAGDYQIRYAGDKNHEAGASVSVTVGKKADQSKPEGLEAVNVSAEDAKDGEITGVSDTMEYSVDKGTTWKTVPANTDKIGGLAAGEVLVRYAETDDKNASPAATVVVGVASNMNAGLKISQTGSKINIKWGKVKEADGYDVYVAYCGKKFGKAVKTINKNSTTSITVKKINGKKINLKKNIKVYVAAYKMVDGKKEVLAKSIMGHVVGRLNTKYSNAKKITLSKSKYSVKVGKTVKVKAKTVLVDKSKKQLSDGHAKEFRYATSNKNIATVDKNGKVKGVAKGTCTIYVYARNGYAKTVKVTVK